MTHLTEAERKTLNDAMEIILARVAYRSSYQIGVSHYDECSKSFDITYFSPAGGQHGWVKGETFADKIEWTIACADREGFSEEQRRQKRIETLRSELSKLTGEAA